MDPPAIESKTEKHAGKECTNWPVLPTFLMIMCFLLLIQPNFMLLDAPLSPLGTHIV